MNVLPQMTMFHELHACLDRFRVELLARGKDLAGTRMAYYMKTLEQMSEVWGPGIEKERLREFALVLYESSELAWIFKHVWGVCDDDTKSLFFEALMGPNHTADEKPASVKPRSTVTELAVAARLNMAGMTTRGVVEPDLLFDLGGTKIFVACKRLSSEKQIRRNIRDALEQIQRASLIPRRNAKRGIVALDISKLSNPDSWIVHAPSVEALSAMAEKVKADFLSMYVNPLHAKPTHLYCLGYLIKFSFVGQFPDGSFITASTWAFHSFTMGGTINHNLAMELRRKFDASSSFDWSDPSPLVIGG